jgi:hypothetical protein
MSLTDAFRTTAGLSTVSFSGKPEDWHEWKYLFEAYVHQLGLGAHLAYAEPWSDEEFNRQSDEVKAAVSRLLYILLTATASSKTAQAIIRRCRTGDGVAAWLALCKHYEPNDRRRKHILETGTVGPGGYQIYGRVRNLVPPRFNRTSMSK